MGGSKRTKFSGRPVVVSTIGIDQRQLFGQRGAYLREIELEFPVKIVARGDEIQIYGDPEPSEQVKALFEDMIRHIADGG
ncbi:MAG TPA: hypothetical protein ENG11_03160, partial [candidate division Zixibacteria bacterium]|nr:hypothetical protein [candidate division Zixibacteria bacterium]